MRRPNASAAYGLQVSNTSSPLRISIRSIGADVIASTLNATSAPSKRRMSPIIADRTATPVVVPRFGSSENSSASLAKSVRTSSTMRHPVVA